jgi:hypothetical protein
MAQYKSPFEGDPHTEQVIGPDGAMSFKITTMTLSPMRARIVDIIAGAVVGYMILIGIAVTIQQNDPWGLVFFCGGAVVLRRLIRRWIAEEFEARTVLTFTADSFTVRRGRSGRQDSFDRQHSHRFSLIQHDRAPEEQRQHEHEQREDQMKRRVVWRKPYYQDSYIVSFDYLGQRNDLMEVYGRKDALAILARLKACDEVMEAQSRKGKGTPLSPAQEWPVQPGDIPETA